MMLKADDEVIRIFNMITASADALHKMSNRGIYKKILTKMEELLNINPLIKNISK